jgi:hypothetical protein
LCGFLGALGHAAAGGSEGDNIRHRVGSAGRELLASANIANCIIIMGTMKAAGITSVGHGE